MGRTREQLRDEALGLTEEDRLLLAQDLVGSVDTDAEWWQAWSAEADRRYQRLASGIDAGLTAEEFWADE